MTDFTTNQVMQITAEGNYSISYTVGSDYNMDMLWLDTNLYQGSKVEVDVTGVTITSADGTSKSYTVDNGGLKTPGSLWGYRDSSNYNNYAATIVNQYLHILPMDIAIIMKNTQSMVSMIQIRSICLIRHR